jgi:hypothetical protein
MATNYNNQQTGNTTVRLPFYGTLSTRAGDSTKDQRFINCIAESDKNETIKQTITQLYKRPGTVTAFSTATGEGRGMLYFDGAFYIAVGNKLYKSPSTTAILTFPTSTGTVGMKLGDSVALGQYLFVCDGTRAWIIETDGTITSIGDDMVDSITVDVGGTGYTTAAISFTGGGGGVGLTATATIVGGVITGITVDTPGSGYTAAPAVVITGTNTTPASATAFLTGFPNPHVPSPSFMDGYMFLVKGTDIWNCYLDNPLKWSPAEFITAEMYPDPILGLARQNNQLIALGQYSTEYFFDAGNATGSPLSKNDAITFQLGLAAPNAISEDERTVLWVAQSRLGGRSVWMIDGFQAKQLGANPIERLLDLETDMDAVTGFVVRTKGHYLYVLNLPTANRTVVYDMEEKVWTEWSSFDGTSHNVFSYAHAADDNGGKPYLLSNTTGAVVKLDPTVFTDVGSAIRYQVDTPRFDAGTYNRKVLYDLTLVGDATSTSVVPQLVSVRWSDNDQQTYSPVRTLDLNKPNPILTQCGTFRRRSFEIYYDGNTDFRLEAVELTYSVGEH